jgi:hypothetical protein
VPVFEAVAQPDEELQVLAHRVVRVRPPLFNWQVAEVIAAYRSQADAEAGFRQLKDRRAVSFSPMFHWTEQKIRVHVFYCVLALASAHLHGISASPLAARYGASIAKAGKVPEKAPAAEPRDPASRLGGTPWPRTAAGPRSVMSCTSKPAAGVTSAAVHSCWVMTGGRS